MTYILCALFVAGAIVYGVNLDNNQQQIADNQRHIEEIQRRTSDKVLCPWAALFVTAVNNPSPEQQERQRADPKAKEDFDRAKETIMQSYEALGCPPLR